MLELLLPTQSKYVRLQIRGRLQTEPSTCTKYACTSQALAFALQTDKYVVFVNWGTPASPLSEVFWRKGGRRSLALNQSMWHMVLTRYCPWEMWAHWKSPTSQEASIRFTKLKCGPLASFQGYWSQALKLRNIWGLLRALTEQSPPSIDVSVLCGTLPLLSHNCF